MPVETTLSTPTNLSEARYEQTARKMMVTAVEYYDELFRSLPAAERADIIIELDSEVIIIRFFSNTIEGF